MINRKQVETFLVEKGGYLKKSPLETAKRLWIISNRHTLPKNKTELQKELDLISEVQSILRTAKTIQNTSAEDRLLSIYDDILTQKNKPKRKLFFDIEVSANIVFSWRIGHEVMLTHDSIIKERAIICVCWKWNDENTVHSLEWNKGDDKELCKKFAKIKHK